MTSPTRWINLDIVNGCVRVDVTSSTTPCHLPYRWLIECLMNSCCHTRLVEFLGFPPRVNQFGNIGETRKDCICLGEFYLLLYLFRSLLKGNRLRHMRDLSVCILLLKIWLLEFGSKGGIEFGMKSWDNRF